MNAKSVSNLTHEGIPVESDPLLVGWAPPTFPTRCGAKGWKTVGGACPTRIAPSLTIFPS
jgi:hypothetical protein